MTETLPFFRSKIELIKRRALFIFTSPFNRKKLLLTLKFLISKFSSNFSGFVTSELLLR